MRSQTDAPPTLPSRLYKYRPIDKWLRSILVDHELYFNSAARFNDPYECIVRCDPTIDQEAFVAQFVRNFEDAELRARSRAWLSQSAPELLSLTPEQMAREFLKRGHLQDRATQVAMVKRLSVMLFGSATFCCFADNPTSVLMWSHYADYHRGVCIEFSTGEFPLSSARPVQYLEQRPTLPMWHPREEEFLAMTMLTKGRSWEYESEWRALWYPAEPGPKKFPRSAVTAVIVGAGAGAEQRSQVERLIAEGGLSAELRRAVMSESDFSLEVRPEERP